MKAYLAVTVDSKLYRKIEALRGREKRSTFVEYLLWLGIEEHIKRPREPKGSQMKKSGI
ncbi:MAG: hypothetical protein QXN98_01230 [Candidatus Bathyarchaeia archaeon]